MGHHSIAGAAILMARSGSWSEFRDGTVQGAKRAYSERLSHLNDCIHADTKAGKPNHEQPLWRNQIKAR
jgi:hypothetical protein